MRIVYVAYSCSPSYGSEDAVGWNIPVQSATEGNDVIVVTKSESKASIELWMNNNSIAGNMKFYYIENSSYLKMIAKGPLYTLRLFEFANKTKKLIQSMIESQKIDIIHQITPVEFRSIGDYGNFDNIKYIVGPVAGGQQIHKSFKKMLQNKFPENLREWINSCVINSKHYQRKIANIDYMLFANWETKKYFEEHGVKPKKTALYPEVGIAEINNTESHRKDNKTVFMMVGRLIPIKGFDLVLDAVKHINCNEYEVNIYGAGPLEKHIISRIEDEKLSDKVHYKGYAPYETILQEYKNADVLIMPSLREATGTVMIEAMQNGIPVITFNQFGARLIVSNESGYVIEVSDSLEKNIRSLKDTMEFIIHNKADCIAKGHNCLKSVESLLWKNKYQYYQDIYSNEMEGDSSE